MIELWKMIRRVLHVIAKVFAFTCFGFGSLVLAMLIFPLLTLIISPMFRAKNIMRELVRTAFRYFVNLMRVLRLITIDIENYSMLKNARQMVICANHPSLIDVVILIGLVPRADCIVKASLWNNFFLRNIVGRIYIPNSLDVEDTILQCKKSLEMGNNLVIFPEGTRTSFSKPVKFQRSAAQISLRTGYKILPVEIVADYPNGLSKGDSIFSAPANGIVRFSLKIKKPIIPENYIKNPIPKASRTLTNDLLQAIIADQGESLECTA